MSRINSISAFLYRSRAELDRLNCTARKAYNRRNNRGSMIHKLLLALSISDIFVVAGLLALFSLPNLSADFQLHWPHIGPWLIPIVQIALLTSVYTTVLISLERYVRIVYVCNLRICRFFNKENFK